MAERLAHGLQSFSPGKLFLIARKKEHLKTIAELVKQRLRQGKVLVKEGNCDIKCRVFGGHF
jgi:hypothetical protein